MTLIDFKIIGKVNEGSNARNTLWGAGALSAENFSISNTYTHTYKLYLTTLASSAKFAGFHKGREKHNIFTSKKNTKRV